MTTEQTNPLWKMFHIRWQFLTALCGSVPADPEIVSAWLDARKPKAMPPGGKSIIAIQEEVFSTIAEPDDRQATEDRSLLVFQRIDGHLVMRSGTVRAHLKECARVISTQHVGKIRGELAFSTRFINCVYPDERQYWIPINDKEGRPLRASDGFRDKAVHTFRGNALKRIEYVIEPSMEFTLKVLGGRVQMEDLETVMGYGGVHGYGGERGDGEGKYVFEIEAVDALKASSVPACNGRA